MSSLIKKLKNDFNKRYFVVRKISAKHHFGMPSEIFVADLRNDGENNQLDPDNARDNNPSPLPSNDIIGRSESLTTQPVAEQQQGGDVNIVRQLTDEQRRQLEPNFAMMATLRRIFYEHGNETTYLLMKYLVDVVAPMIVNTFHEVIHRPGASSHSIQTQANPTNQCLLGLFLHLLLLKLLLVL